MGINKDIHRQTLCRVWSWTLSTKWYTSNIFIPIPEKMTWKVLETVCMKNIRRRKSNKCTEQRSYELTKTETASRRPAWVYTMYSVFIYDFQIYVFRWVLNFSMNGSLIMNHSPVLFFFLLICFLQPRDASFVSSYIYFAIF